MGVSTLLTFFGFFTGFDPQGKKLYKERCGRGGGSYLVRIPFLFRRNPRMVIAAHETSDMGERS